MTRRLGALCLVFLLASCTASSDGNDPGGADVADPGPADTAFEAADPAPETADPSPADLPKDPAPADPAQDPAAEAVDAAADTPADARPDGVMDVPPPTCCMYDYMCPVGWECVAIPGAMGSCKPIPGPDACWSGHDCGPGRTCLGAVPCPCDQDGEGDGCDIPGHCVDDTEGCCDSDWECPVGQVCAPGGTCRDAPAPGLCWRKADCYATGQDCVGVVDCGCGLDCFAAPAPGTCSPLPHACCNSDADCPDDTECRFAEAVGHLPGRCVAAHLGAACPGDTACCWGDLDCPGGYCEGAAGCGCIELCPMCGACEADRMGTCRAWTIDVEVTSSAGHCEPGDGHPAFTHYLLPLAWHTSLPARTQIEQALNAFTGGEGYMPMEEGFVQDHAFDLRLGSMYFAPPPRVGDVMLIRVRALGEQGQKGLSEPLRIPVDAALADCLFPYDRTCSDGTPLMCRALPPPCDADKVMAAYQGCQHCVYATTCSCDDGTTATCKMQPPTCEAGRVLAVQDNCYACVSPSTCNDLSP